jgi:hypothetical protein
LLAHGIANVAVSRKNSVAKEEKNERKQTYGGLENQGKLLLSTVNGLTFVSLPFPWVKDFSQVNDEPYYAVLNKLISKLNYAENRLWWQDFEECSLLYDALREMSLYRCGHEEATLEELYPGSRGRTCILQQKYYVSKDVTVDFCKGQVNGDEQLVNKKNQTIAGEDVYKHSLLNGVGARHDLFHDRLREKSTYRTRSNIVRSRVAIQCKLLVGRGMNKKTLQEEVDKVENGVKGTELQDEIVVVVLATGLSKDLDGCKSEEFPDGCIVLSGQALYNYFGSPFQYRMFMDILPPTEGVFVNTDDFSMLCKVPNIEETLASRIIETRSERHFENWDDLKNRVKYIPEAAKDWFYFGKQEEAE